MQQHDAPAQEAHDQPFAFTEERVAACMAHAMRQVLTDPEVHAAVGSVAFAALQRHAAEVTGGFLLGTLRRVLMRWLIIATVMLVIAKYLGVSSAVKLWASFTGDPK